MSSQTKLIKDILSTYDAILENKKISEAEDVYDNVNFKSIGHGNPSSDNINTTLLQDVQTAAKNAGLNVDITTAISGHDKGTRHETGNAVDIAIINGIGSDGATNNTNGNAKFRELGNKLKDVLVSMGYVWNSESGNPKAILWQTNTGGNHFNHVHVSNTTTSTSQPDNTSPTTSGETTTNTSGEDTSGETTTDDNFAKRVGGAILKAARIKEERIYSSFGKDYSVRYGEIIIPKEDNKKIKSPVSGVITSYRYNSRCDNQLVINFLIDDNDYYLEYCGLSSVSVRNGESVEKGDLLGLSDSDVTVILYNSIGSKKQIDPNLKSTPNNTDNDSDSRITPEDGMFATTYKKIKSMYKDKDKEKNDDDENYNDRMFTTAYKTVRDTWFKKDKLKEDIERIKGLL